MKVSFEYDRGYSPALPVLELQVSGADPTRSRTLTGLIDSGPDATQLPLTTLRAIGARPVDRRWVRDLAGIRYAVVVYSVRLQIGDLLMPEMEVVGREGITEIIIGRDVLNQLIVTLNGLAFVTEVTD